MRRFAALVLAVVVAGAGAAQAKEARGTSDWGAVERLKPGTKVVVEELGTPVDIRYQVPCKVVRVDGASLTCRQEGERNQRVVYPAGQVLSVYRVKMRVTAGSWVRVVLFGGLGFAMGCAITDENADYPLGGVGAAAGASYGLEHISRRPKFEIVYWRTETQEKRAVAPGL